MKKGLALLGVIGFGAINTTVMAQDAAEESQGFIYMLKEKFIEGDPFWMALPLICLILGLAFVIERIIYLNAVDINTDKFLEKFNEALNSGGYEEAKNVARDTKGPVASLAYQAALRVGNGASIEEAEKSVIGYGSVEVGKLDRNISWISLFIAVAPMLGFMGTVVGMIMAFSDIKISGSVDPADMAGNIQVALLTTMLGLIVAIILQIFYNYLSAKIDAIVNGMENASITIVDLLVKKTAK